MERNIRLSVGDVDVFVKKAALCGGMASVFSRNVLGPGDLGLKQRTQDMAGMITGMIFHLNSQSGCACYGMYYSSTSTQVLRGLTRECNQYHKLCIFAKGLLSFCTWYSVMQYHFFFVK